MADSKLLALPAAAALTGNEAVYGVQAGTDVQITTSAIAALSGGGTGNVVGPASATDNSIARYDGVTGKLIQNSAVGVTDAGGLQFASILPPAYTPYTLFADQTNDCLTYYNSDANVMLQIGQEEWVRVLNNTGSSIPNGSAVQISGAATGLPTVSLAQSNSNIIGLGLTTETIANGAIGLVTRSGMVRGVDTSAFAAGAAIYVSPSVAGALTTTRPVAPNYAVLVGSVSVSDAVVGTIMVSQPTTQLGFGAADQSLSMNAAGTAQEYKTMSVGTAGTDFAIVQGTGTTTFNLPDASATARGVVTTGTQSFAGAKTFGTTVTVSGTFTANSAVNTLGASTGTSTANVGTGATAAATTKTVNLGTAGVSTSVTNVNIGSAVAGATGTTTVNSVNMTFGTNNTNITASRALTINASRQLATITTTDTELGYVSGVTSAIQTQLNAKGSGTVTSASVVPANGFAGSVATATTTPAITLSTSVTGIVKGDGTALSAATSGTDYSAGTSALATGIVKTTTGTGALTVAVAGDFPTLNQNTTGSAATLTTTRTFAIAGTTGLTAAAQNFNGAANVSLPLTGTLAVANGGTGQMTYTDGQLLIGNTTGNTLAKATLTAGTGITVTNGTGSITIASSLTSITNALAANVLLTNVTTYFTGPSVAQGTSGTWLVTACISLGSGSGGIDGAVARLSDGTTVIASCAFGISAATDTALTLSGVITNPAGNLRIEVKDVGSTAGKILFNDSGNGKDSIITAVRIG